MYKQILEAELPVQNQTTNIGEHSNDQLPKTRAKTENVSKSANMNVYVSQFHKYLIVYKGFKSRNVKSELRQIIIWEKIGKYSS